MPILTNHTDWDTPVNTHLLREERAKLALGRNIYYLRKYRGFSQAELAEIIKAPQRSISEMESGTSNMTFDKMERLAEALGVSVSVLTSEKMNWRMIEMVEYFMRKLDGTIDTLKALKLAYFTDLLHKEQTGEKFTNLSYIRYNFWPFTEDIYTIKTIFREVDKNTVANEKPFVSNVFLEDADKSFLDSILAKYGKFSGTELMKQSYKTEPMERIGAKLGGNEHMMETVL